MKNTKNLQESLLSNCRTARTAVTVFLMNGYQLRGAITGFDPFVVVLQTDEKQQIIYKHAISTIIPEQKMELEVGEG